MKVDLRQKIKLKLRFEAIDSEPHNAFLGQSFTQFLTCVTIDLKYILPFHEIKLKVKNFTNSILKYFTYRKGFVRMYALSSLEFTYFNSKTLRFNWRKNWHLMSICLVLKFSLLFLKNKCQIHYHRTELILFFHIN